MVASWRREVKIPVGNRFLEGSLVVPDGARAIIIFAHGTGSSRFSPRNTMVAHKLRPAGFGTLLFDLVTAVEDRDPIRRTDISMMAERLQSVNKWIGVQADTSRLPIGYYGSSSGAAVAIAASMISEKPYAIVSRGGRLDQVSHLLPKLDIPIQLIAGENDPEVLAVNKSAYAQIRSVKKLAVIKDASHLFEEPGCMDKVAQLSTEWFIRHLPNHAS
jgi:predicted alpha/beta-hydrolase family hydrolase